MGFDYHIWILGMKLLAGHLYFKLSDIRFAKKNLSLQV